MQGSRRGRNGWGPYALPLLVIIALVTSYVVLAQWQDLPQLFASAFAAVRWPTSG